METLNIENLKIKNKSNYASNYFESVEYSIKRINKYITKKGNIASKQEGEYEILCFAMENEVEAQSLVYALSLSRDNMEKARQIIRK